MSTFKTSVLAMFVDILAMMGAFCYGVTPAHGEIVYQTTFDSLSIGLTQPFPGAPGQDGWYRLLAVGDAFGEIQNVVANPGRALHEHTAATVPPNLQTIDLRKVTPPDLNTHPIVTLRVDFYAHSSNLDAVNNYIASFVARGGPHPDFDIIGFDLYAGAGYGNPKSQTGVSVTLLAFNGVNNNDPVPLTVGQGLTWDTWHNIVISLDQENDSYLYITVDGQTQNLNGFKPPRNDDGTQWLRGQLIEYLVADIIPDDFGGIRTDDDVYWDNVHLEVQAIPAIVVDIDIKPGSLSNKINPNNKGVIPVAILTSDTFDASSVDPLSVRFGPNGAPEAHKRGHIEDIDRDGDLDMVLHFRTQRTGIGCETTSATLTGETFDGQPITGSDSIKTVGCR